MGRREKQRYLTFRGILFVLLFAVVIPVALLTSAGIVAIILGRGTVALVTGILVLSLAAAVFTGVFIILLLLRRGIRLAREQDAFLSNVTHELRAPMARSVIGGLMVSTFLTLVFIPVLYTIFERKKNKAKVKE